MGDCTQTHEWIRGCQSHCLREARERKARAAKGASGLNRREEEETGGGKEKEVTGGSVLRVKAS